MTTNTTKKREIITIIDNDIVIGFIARRRVVFGVCEIDHLWCVTHNLCTKGWFGAFPTRKGAIEFLKNN